MSRRTDGRRPLAGRPHSARAIILATMIVSCLVGPTEAAELRGFWADIWGVGFKSSADITDMVNRAVQGRYNCIFMEVMGYQDNRSSAHGAYWNSSVIPKATDIVGGIDPLAELCTQAHAQGLQVHAWMVPYRACDVWPPLNNTLLTNHAEYLMVPRGNINGGAVAFGDPAAYYLDPGSPEVQEHTVEIVPRVDDLPHRRHPLRHHPLCANRRGLSGVNLVRKLESETLPADHRTLGYTGCHGRHRMERLSPTRHHRVGPQMPRRDPLADQSPPARQALRCAHHLGRCPGRFHPARMPTSSFRTGRNGNDSDSWTQPSP